jgi:hypothetical protein
MHQRQLGIDARGLLEFFHGAVVHPVGHVRLADDQVELRRVMADFDQARGGAPVEIREAGLVGGDGHYVEVVQVFGLARPQRLQRLGGFRIAFLEEIAETQQVARLGGFRLIAHHRFEGLNRVLIIGLPVIDQPDIQPDAGHLGRQPLGGLQLRQGRRPFLAAHVHDGQIAVRAHVVRLGRQHCAEVLLGRGQVAGIHGMLAALEDLPGIGRLRGRQDKN